MLPRLVATDLDGTLLRDDGTLDERTCRALETMQAHGVMIVMCTARPARWITDIAAAGGIRGPAVCANGAVIWDLADRALIDSFPVASDVAREVVARLRPLMPTGTWAIEGVDSFAHEPSYVPRWPVPDDTVVDHVEALLIRPPVKLLFRCAAQSPAALGAEVRRLVGDLVEVTYSSSDTLLELSAAGVSKGSGLAALCAHHGVPAEHVVAFGDMPNDLPMLDWAGRGVAMGNAHSEVLAAADEVTLTNEQSGVAVRLERLLADG